MIYGVTVDDIAPLPDIVDSLAHLSRRPTTRIVFDEFMPATYYAEAAASIHEVSDVMGELLDSFYVALYSPAAYRARAAEYLSVVGESVDIWEVGNEINGEWLCGQEALSCTASETAQVVEKMTSAFELVEDSGGQTALTLYYNEDCWASPDNEMFTWVDNNVPPAMRTGLDYVFVSYYEDDCNGLVPDWDVVFARLALAFPDAKLGFGECGTTDAQQKEAFIRRYYGMQMDEPRFVGGWFWWYFVDDMVPRHKPLWSVLDDVFSP